VEGKGEVKEYGLLRKECRQSKRWVLVVVRVRNLNKRRSAVWRLLVSDHAMPKMRLYRTVSWKYFVDMELSSTNRSKTCCII
jgi:hypothetical protein